MSISRNDPCPCGSGRKYKKCHGLERGVAAPSAEVSRANEVKAADREMADRLMRFARTRYGTHWLHDALESIAHVTGGDVSEAELPIVIPWLQHFRVDPAHGLTLAAEWREQQPRHSGDARALLDAYAHSWLSIWEALEVQPGVGSRLKDLLTGEERFVHDVLTSRSLQRYDALLALVVTCNGISFLSGIHSRALPPRFAQEAVTEARRLCRVRTRPVAHEKLRDPDLQLELLALWSDRVHAMLHQPPPALQNTDGDPYLMTRDDFALLAPRAEIARRLATLPGVQEPEQEDDDDVFTIIKAGNAVHGSWDNTIIGRIVLSDDRLTVETNSTRRADTLRHAVESHLQGQVQFRLRAEENTEHMLARARAGQLRQPQPRPQNSPELIALARQMREQYMRGWLDDHVPALGGLTPREAARQPRARQKLEVLLKEMEQSEQRLAEEERIDLAWLRKTLGLG